MDAWEKWTLYMDEFTPAKTILTKLEDEYENNNKEREKIWIKNEPKYEKAVEEQNKIPGIKFAHMGNFEDLVAWACKTSKNQLLLNFYDDSKSEKAGRATSELSFERWSDAAARLAAAEVDTITMAMVDCGRFARLCYSHPIIGFPYRRDLFPQGVLFSAKHPSGKVFKLDLNKELSWKDTLQYVPHKDVLEDALLQIGAHEKLMKVEATAAADEGSLISEDEMDEL